MSSGGEFWTTESAPVDDVPARWQQMLSATHLPWEVRSPAPEPGRIFHASVHRGWIEDLALVDCVCSPCSGTRQRHQLAATAGEFIVLLITRSGQETVGQGRTEASLQPGDAVAWDSTRPARFTVWQLLSKRSLLIPRAALDEVSGRGWTMPGTVLNGSSPAVRLLIDYLDVLRATLGDLGPSAVTAARNATLELFSGALRADSDVASAATARPALRAAMGRYIERHLLDVELTQSALATAHGVSCRTVNRIFSDTGQTVGEVVRVRRLARARDELIGSDQLISGIAHRWGFSDSSHFSRSFKAHYGSSPSAYREGVRAGLSLPPPDERAAAEASAPGL
jgi:AraC family transcriptional regulator, positive regulator of tynA and feaB